MNRELPTGTVTYLFTDIEGSTRLWELVPETAHKALIRHDHIIEEGVSRHHGLLVRPRGEGDSRFAVFPRAKDAVAAAAYLQQALANEPWTTPDPLLVRIAIHTGEANLRMGDYYGSVVNRCARLRAIAYGGQTLISRSTAELVRDFLPENSALRDMGQHRLKDLTRPEHVYQLVIAGLRSQFPPLKSLDAYAHNLPAQTTPLVGREDEIAQTLDLLRRPEVRLLTLTGPGGTGKTRLGLRVAGESIDHFADGVFFVDLANIVDPELVASKIAQQVGVREAGPQTILDNLLSNLRDKQMLLLLDNFEQVIEAAPIVAQLLAAAVDLKVLITSRSLLNLRGEHEFQVPTLAIPPADTLPSVDDLSQYAAIQLFVERAAAANPRFSLTAESAPLVAEICRKLDGLPLAIELAAARIKLLPPKALLDRLSDRLKLLTGGARDLPKRQQTLRSTIDWSYSLLNEEEQILFERLGIFVGGFTLEAAEAVVNAEGNLDVLDGIELLLNKSLLQHGEDAFGLSRFWLLETIREYARERLEMRGDFAQLQEGHGQYFARFSMEIGQQLYSEKASPSLDILEADHDNIRTALTWLLTNPTGLEFSQMMILINLIWFWYRRGYFAEGREWSERFLAFADVTERSEDRGGALLATGSMALWQGDLNAAVSCVEESLKTLRRLEDKFSLSFCLLINGVVSLNRGQDSAARAFLMESLSLFRELGIPWLVATALIHLGNASLGLGRIEDAHAWLEEGEAISRRLREEWLTSFALNNRGELARVQGNYKRARSYYEESASLLRSQGDMGDLARLIHTLGYIALQDEDIDGAETGFQESLAMFRKIGNRRGIAECLAGLAGVAAASGRFNRAARLLGAAEALLQASGAAWWPADRAEIDRHRAIIQTQLGEDSFASAWQEGQSMTLDKAIALSDQAITLSIK